MQGGLVGCGKTPALPPKGPECPPACTVLAKRASLRENERSLVVRREEAGTEMERRRREGRDGGGKTRDKDNKINKQDNKRKAVGVVPSYLLW